MEKIRELSFFYNAIKEDCRIGPSHISIYMALFQLYNLNGFQNPVYVSRRIVMELAKISGIATFHKCISDLGELGYIAYRPSYNPAYRSQVELLIRTGIE